MLTWRCIVVRTFEKCRVSGGGRCVDIFGSCVFRSQSCESDDPFCTMCASKQAKDGPIAYANVPKKKKVVKGTRRNPLYALRS